MRCTVLMSGLFCVLLLGVAEVSYSGGVISPEEANEIVLLARDGKNVQAIAIYEKLPEDIDVSLVVMRSVAGCYWREKRFDESRELYQKILDRRPTLHSLSDSSKSIPKPLPATSATSEKETNVATKKSEVAAKRSAEVEAELTRLREANATLAKERDDFRKKTAEQIASVTAAARLTADGAEELRAELVDAREKRLVAEKVSEQIQQSMEKQSVDLNTKVAELEKYLVAAQSEVVAVGELHGLHESKKLEVEELEKALSKEQGERTKHEEKSKELQAILAKSSTELRSEISCLEDKLQIAEMEVSAGWAEVDKRINENRTSADEFAEKISDLEDRSNSARYEIVALSSALEIARLKNAELSAKSSVTEDKTEAQMEMMAETALSLALAEIDALEREYEALDIQADRRQYELLARIDTLEQTTVTGEADLNNVQQQLDMERSLRIALNEQSEKSNGMLLDANKLLAETTEKLALQFGAFREQMLEGKLRDNSVTPADLAPLIGRLEDATSSAAVEVKDLRRVLSEERELHAQELLQSKNEIAGLRRQVEALNQSINVLNAEITKQEEKWLTEMGSKLTEIREIGVKREANLKEDADKRIAESIAEHKEREAELGKEITALADKIKVSSETLEQVKQNLVKESSKYAELVSVTGDTESGLRQRIHDLELAFSLPKTTDVDNGDDVRKGNPELDAKVSDLYQSIIDTSLMNKSLAISRYESLPAESEKPLVLIKTVANLYRDKMSYDVAYKMYEEILARDPGNLYAERKIVITLFDMGRYDEARARLSGGEE